MQPLPPDLVATLRRARTVEALAGNLAQQRRAVQATGALLLAAVRSGWTVGAVSIAAGLKPGTGQKRIAEARQRLGDAHLGLAIDEAPRAVPTLAQRLEVPVERREWLTTREAADFTGQSSGHDRVLAAGGTAAQH